MHSAIDHDCTLNDRFGKPSCMTEFEQEIREDERERHGEDWRGGYDKALDAAREAVANAPMASGAFNTKAADLAAIDALRHAGAKNQQTSCAGNC